MKQIFTTVIFIFLYYTGFSQTWIQKQTFPGADRARNGAFSIPSLGKGYIVGGGGLSSNYLPDCWAYDTLSDSWTQIANYPGNDDDAICFSANGKGYATTGGACCPNYTNAMFEYDPVGDSWTTKTPMPGDKRTFCVGFDIGGKFYVGGGVNNLGSGTSNANPYKDFYAYDPLADTWARIADCPASGVNAFAIGFAINGKGYVGTGDTVFNNGSSYVATKDFWEYDPVTDHWTRKADFAGGTRAGAVGFATCNYGYVGCGATVGSQDQTVNDFWRYDPVTDHWTQLASFNGADRVYACVFGFKNTAYICDGFVPGTLARPPELYEFIQTVIPAFTTAGSSSTTICVGQSISYTDTSNYAPTSWLWNFPGGTPSSSTSQSPLIQYNSVGKYDVTLSAWNGCDSAAKTFSQYITVSSSATLSILPASPKICSGKSITLSVAGGGTNFVWTPSTGLNKTTGDSVIASPGSTIVYTVSGSGACASVPGTDTITVDLPTPLSVSPASPQVCPGKGVTLTVTGGTGTITWTPSSGLNQSSGANVIASPTSTTVYTATEQGGCSTPGTDSVIITTPAPITIDPANAAICAGETVTLTASGGTGITWSPSTGLNVTSGTIVIANAPISDSMMYSLSGINILGCIVEGQVTVHNGGSSIPGTIHAIRDTICQGTPGNLSLVGNSTNTIQWKSSTDGINFTDITGVTDTTRYRTQPLLQDAWYFAAVGSGVCVANSDTLELIVPPPLSAFFNASQTAINQLAFNSDSSEGTISSYHWDFGDGETSNERDPIHSYQKDTTYYVCLTLYDGSNCSYTFCRYLNSTLEAVPIILAAGDWLIYPNPFRNQLTINSKFASANPSFGGQTNNHIQKIEMYDVLGRLMINESVDHSTNTSLLLDVSVLAKGMYFLKIKTADADYLQKVVKQ